jgi:hypothetical protein
VAHGDRVAYLPHRLSLVSQNESRPRYPQHQPGLVMASTLPALVSAHRRIRIGYKLALQFAEVHFAPGGFMT